MLIKTALSEANIERLDAEVMLAHTLNTSKEWLYAHQEENMTASQKETFSHMQKRRKDGEPVAYIIGKKEFYGREFTVAPAVLIPRPATEHLIDITCETLQNRRAIKREADTGIVVFSHILAKEKPRIVVDIGTGSGCIAITLKKELPEYKILGTDISEDALSIAKQNAKNLGVQIEWLCGSLLSPITLQDPFFVVSNPPYVPQNENVDEEVRKYEPHKAVFAGTDGMTVINKLVDQCKLHPHCMGFALECREEQLKSLQLKVTLNS